MMAAERDGGVTDGYEIVPLSDRVMGERRSLTDEARGGEMNREEDKRRGESWQLCLSVFREMRELDRRVNRSSSEATAGLSC